MDTRRLNRPVQTPPVTMIVGKKAMTFSGKSFVLLRRRELGIDWHALQLNEPVPVQPKPSGVASVGAAAIVAVPPAACGAWSWRFCRCPVARAVSPDRVVPSTACCRSSHLDYRPAPPCKGPSARGQQLVFRATPSTEWAGHSVLAVGWQALPPHRRRCIAGLPQGAWCF